MWGRDRSLLVLVEWVAGMMEQGAPDRQSCWMGQQLGGEMNLTIRFSLFPLSLHRAKEYTFP